MPNDMIRYDLLVQEALCGVVKRVLNDAAREGLPGEHHFYITFRTHAPGVRLTNRMREQYPEEMTIILQHQFEKLSVSDAEFQVELSFKGVPELLVIPFDALTGFFDPSVQFGLKFELHPEAETEDGDESEEDAETSAEAKKPAGLPATPFKLGGMPAAIPQPKAEAEAPAAGEAEEAKVVSIDAFRKKP